MLEAVKGNGATPFSIMKHASMNGAQLKKYLESLTEMDFIEMEVKDGRVLYRTSEKGLDFLRQYYVLLEMLLNAYAPNKQTTLFIKLNKPYLTNHKTLRHVLQPSLQDDCNPLLATLTERKGKRN